MIAYSDIKENLDSLDTLYKNNSNNKNAEFASKLAILELCGWIEISMDDCISRASERVLCVDKNHEFMKDKIRRNYGFDYEGHFKPMLVNLIGIWGFEKINETISEQITEKFRAELKVLKEKRNSLAHTYTKGETTTYDAPSVTIDRFESLRKGFEAYDKALKKLLRKLEHISLD